MRKNLKLKKMLSLGVIATMLLAQGSMVLAAAGWVKKSGNWYYYNEKGVKTIGWQSIKGKWYYMNAAGVMQTGWLLDKSKWYYLNPNGDMKTGWLKDENKWYYLNPDGAMKTGWLFDKGEWYYLNPSGDMKTGWLLNGGCWYYLNTDGTMATGFLKESGKTYYLNPNGDMATGLLTVSGKTYYFNTSGDMALGLTTIQGKKYYFSKDGSMVKNTILLEDDVEYVIDKDGVVVSYKNLFQTEEEQEAFEYLKKKKSEQIWAEQSLKETQTLKNEAKELAKQYAQGSAGKTESEIMFYKSSTLKCEDVIDWWLKDEGIEYYDLMRCTEIGFACYQKDNMYYWVCVTKDTRMPS